MAVEDLRNLVEVKGPDILITLVEIQSLIEQADKLCEEEAALWDRAKNTRDYDAYEKYLEVNRLGKLVNECAYNIVARAQEQAKADKVKIIMETASKTNNT